MRLPTTITLYAVCYTAFLFLTKLAGGDNPLALLPVTTAAGALTWIGVATWRGWWRVGRYDRDATIAAASSVVILFSSVIAYAQRGASLLLPLVMMQGGMLLVARAIDRIKHRPVSRDASNVLALVAAGIGVALWPQVASAAGLILPEPDARRAGITVLACATLYMLAYAGKLMALDGRKGGSRGRADVDWSFLVGEITMTVTMAVPASLLVAAVGGVHLHQVALHACDPRAWGAGATSQGTGFFGAMIYLSAGPHSVCVPLTRAGKMIAGIVAATALAVVAPEAARAHPPSVWEVVGALVLAPALWIGVRAR